MMKSFTFLFAGLILISLTATAQIKIKKGGKNTIDLPVVIIPEYTLAENLAKEAIAQLKAGETKSADSLIKKSITAYPVYEVMAYAKELMILPDMVGANLIMAQLKERVALMQGKILIAGFLEIMMANGNPPKLKEYDKERAYFNVLTWIYNLNRTYASRAYVIASINDLVLPNIIEDKKLMMGFDFDYNQQAAYKIMGATYAGEYSKARTLIDAIPVSPFYQKEVLLTYHITIDIATGDYQKGIERALEIAKNPPYKPASDVWLFNLYATMGDDRAMDYYKKIEPHLKENNYYYYKLALLYLAKQDYITALKHIEKSNSLRKEKMITADMLVEGWDFYKAYGDAYMGLKDYVKARDNYNISLLYYPENELVLNALANLEVLVAKGTSTDKTGPAIAINEPMPNRGLKVTAIGENVMVKGVATDPSGIKEVLINDKVVYAQQSGNFWADVPMVNGINKIKVTTTDMAGNKSEKIFEIEKSAAPVAVANDVIAVAEKEGKNYCLLLAAQNYADSNIPTLENPIADAVKLKLILKNNYNFTESNIFTLFNPATGDLKRQLLELTNTLQPEDNLLIFYAGHGIWVEKEKKGYWLLTDSKYKDVNTWLPNKDVLDLIAKLPSRHTLLITDACFSGSVFKTRGLKPGAPAAIREMENKITRVAITSGNDTEVPDESVFMKYLVKALSENKDQYLSAQKMFINQILEAVMTESKTEPRYGTLELAGHVGGDYIFSRK